MGMMIERNACRKNVQSIAIAGAGTGFRVLGSIAGVPDEFPTRSLSVPVRKSPRLTRIAPRGPGKSPY